MFSLSNLKITEIPRRVAAPHNEMDRLVHAPWNRKILLVEDEALIALDIGNDLEDWGFDVCGIVATNRDAMRLVDACHPELALVDVSLGKESGIDVANALRAKGVEIVFLTAHSDRQTRAAMHSVGPLACLFKPYSPQLLRRTLERQDH